MSRTNPSKNKRRWARNTLLLYCEGSDEKAFLGYLKEFFAKDSGIAVTIKENHGGGANEVLRGVLKHDLLDNNACIYDTDTGVDIEIKQKVEKKGILCLENKPCLEAFLLNILEEKDYSNYKKCNRCKKIFELKYLDKRKRKDKRNYEKIFPKELLLKNTKKIENLKTLISLINGDYVNKN